jgi:hypothetical protein
VLATDNPQNPDCVRHPLAATAASTAVAASIRSAKTQLTDRSGRPILHQDSAARSLPMTTSLDKTLRRQIHLDGQDYIITLTPEGLKITLKGKRKGLELSWTSLVSGDAALAVALNASVGQFAGQSAAEPQRAKPKGETPGPSRRNSRP